MLERLAQGVQRTRTDVAVDDAESTDREAEHPGVVTRVSGVGGGVTHESASLRQHSMSRPPVHGGPRRAHNVG